MARPHLEELVAFTGESSSMAQLDGSDIVYVARVAVPKLISLREDIGTRFPAMVTSQGRALLSAMHRGAVHERLSAPIHSGAPQIQFRLRFVGSVTWKAASLPCPDN